MKALGQNGQRYNLLNSAILECFKYIKDENIKSLVNNVIDNYWTNNSATTVANSTTTTGNNSNNITVSNIKYSNLFNQMKEKYDLNMQEQVMTHQWLIIWLIMIHNMTHHNQWLIRKGEVEPMEIMELDGDSETIQDRYDS